MGNPLRGEAAFTAGATPYTLVFDVNVFCELEADTGLALNELVATIQGSPSFTLLRAVFCAGLQAKHPATTKAQAGTIMSDAGIEEMTGALRRALAMAMPKEVKGDAARPPRSPRKKQAGTG
jgi:hypothetical protein